MSITDDILNAVRMVESGGNPNAVSRAGAQGPYQFMPGTAKQFGIDPFDEAQSREAARKYLTQLTGQFGSVEKALQAYNWGPGNMRAYEATGKGAKGQPMPSETAAYAPKVMSKVGAKPASSGVDLFKEFGIETGAAKPAKDAGGVDLFKEFGIDVAGAKPAPVAAEQPGVLKSLGMGALRGGRDMIDGGAQLLTRALEKAAPTGSAMEQFMRSERQRVEGINRTAEQEFQQGNYGTAGKVGRIGGNVIASLPMGGPLAATTAGRVAQGVAVGGGIGALQKVDENSPDYWAAKREGIGMGAAGGAIGNVMGGKLSDMLGDRIARQAAAQASNAPRDAILRSAQQAGYVVPPTQANPSMLNRALEGFSGKITTGQNASAKNAPVTNELVRKALKQDEGFIATPDALQGIRSEAGKAYEALKQFPRPFAADDAFLGGIAKIEQQTTKVSKQFPSQANASIRSLIDDMIAPEFDQTAAVEMMKKLRFDANANLRAMDDPAKIALGRTQKAVAKELEDLVARNLNAAGEKGLYDSFTKARELIAKTKTVEKAADQAGGVSAMKLAQQLRRGAPLSGELRTVAQFADQFPKAAQAVPGMGSLPQISPLDAVGAAMTGGVTLLRPAAREAILTGPYQRMFAQPGYSNGLLSILGNPLVSGSGAALGAASMLPQY